jgi:hypothetical protein
MINDSDEVVGWAIRNNDMNTRRAYRLKLPPVQQTSCLGKQNGAACNDGNSCTQTDTCQAGICQGANPVVCTALDQCHNAGTCNPSTGLCSAPAKADWTYCNDGQLCTYNDFCVSGSCVGTPKVCMARDQCHEMGTCAPETGLCSNPAVADQTPCNDGSVCTQVDTCVAGVCTGTSPPTCTGSLCQTAACDPAAGAKYPADGLIGLWHLDDNLNDTTVGGSDFAPVNGGPRPVPGRRAAGYAFGGSAWIGQGYTKSLDVSYGSGFTFGAWVKPTGSCPDTGQCSASTVGRGFGSPVPAPERPGSPRPSMSAAAWRTRRRSALCRWERGRSSP